MAGNEESEVGDAAQVVASKPWGWQWVSRFFEGLHWLTERVISLLRLFVTAAMFLVVAFVVYNAWESRNTVVVKPFQVPVNMGEKNHKQVGRIIANLLNRHLLDAQNTLQAQLNRDGVNLNNPVPTEQQVLIEGESIKLPETGITIDNVIEFISGIFGRKNLNGSVYYEADLQDFTKTKLHLQITLRGRIISFSEDDLGEQQRARLPATRPNGLNIQLISAMLKVRSKEILSIASEDYNLYYYCTRETAVIEHDESDYNEFFDYCRQLQSAEVTPQSLLTLKASLNEHDSRYDKSIVGSVLSYLREESHKRQATLCQSKVNQADDACDGVKIADARPLAKTRATNSVLASASQMVVRRPASSDSTESSDIVQPVTAPTMVDAAPVEQAMQPIPMNSLRAVIGRCRFVRTEQEAGSKIVPRLERQCFAESPVQQSVMQQAMGQIASPEAVLQANQAEGDAKQLLHNGLYAESLVKYEEAISLNCNNAVAWANMGILLSTASKESGVQDYSQAQCALLRATTMNESAGWIRHSLCVAQAKEAESDLERFRGYESCQLARQLEPINDALYDKLFYIDIGDRYFELEKYAAAGKAYAQAMSNEKARNCKAKQALTSLLALEQMGVEDARTRACQLYQATLPTVLEDEEVTPACELELNELMAQQSCV